MTAVEQYLARLPADRRDAIGKVRDVINAHLPTGYQETIQYGMIAWVVPESILPAKDVYNKQLLCLASLASQKNHMAVYLLQVYGDPQLRSWFQRAYERSGKKLDMGQSCVRFKTLDALSLDVIGEAMSKVTIDRYVARYRAIRAALKKPATKTAAKKPAPTKAAAKKTAPTKAAAKKRAAKKTATKPAAKKTATKRATRRAR